MGRSFFNGSTDWDLAWGSRLFAEKIGANPGAYGVSDELAAAYVAADAVWQAAYKRMNIPAERTQPAVVAKNEARERVCALASSLAKIIAGNPAVSNEQRVGLQLSVRDQASPLPPPGQPSQFKIRLDGDGSLILSWKCDNPKGSRGTQYELYRSVAGGEFGFLGTVGKKRFRDHSLPEGAAGVVYKLRATRSTKVGAWAEFHVPFGGGMPNPGDLRMAA